MPTHAQHATGNWNWWPGYHNLASQLGISYDCILCLTAQMGNSVCQQFHLEQVACTLKIRGPVFTPAAIYNIDHNPSATTAKSSFNGMCLSLMQCIGEGLDQTIMFTGASREGSATLSLQVQKYYTVVPSVISRMKNVSLWEARLASLTREVKPHKEENIGKYTRQDKF